MMWSIGARYSFGEGEILAMPLSRLKFWYRGHKAMYREEQRAAGVKPKDGE